MNEPDPTPSENAPIESLSLEQGEGRRLYPRMILLLAVGMLAYIPVATLAGGALAQLVAPYVILAGCAVSWVAHLHGRTRTAILLITWVLWVGILLQGAVRGGLTNPAVHAQVVVTMVGGWLLGPRQGIYLGVSSLLATLAMALLIEYKWLVPGPLPDGLHYWIPMATVFTIGLLMTWAVLKAHWRYLRQMRELSRQQHDTLKELSEREAALAASENRFMRVHESSPMPITLSRAEDGRYLDVNPAWERLFGWQRDQVRGRTSADIGFFADTEARRRGLEIFRRSGSVSMEIVGNCRSGEQRSLVCSAEAIDYDGAPAVLTIMFDVTERRRVEDSLRRMNDELEHRVAERTGALEAAVRDLNAAMEDLKRTQGDLVQSEKHASLGRLVAGIAHELNTPIGNALTASTTLGAELAEFDTVMQSGPLKRSQLERMVGMGREGVRIIERSLQRAANLVQSFKKVAVDQASEQRRHFGLREVVSEVVEMMRPSFSRAPWTIHIDIPDDIALDSYPGPLEQIIMNLLDNAVRHAFEGRAEGQVILSGTMKGDQVELRCRDNGVGMPPEVVARIFDPFFTTKLGVGGSGLGMAIVHQLTSNVLRGQITVSSVPAHGSTFSLLIPAVAPMAAVNEGARA